MIDSFRTWICDTGSSAAKPRRLRSAVFSLLVCALGLQPDSAFPQALQPTSDAVPQSAGAARDGQHDFDFNFGVWHTHIRRVLDPLSGSSNSIELNGTVTVRKIWNGRAQLEEIEADGPSGHWEGLTLFLYNPQARQWSQTFADSKKGVMTIATIGSFKDGRGELFAQDTFHDKSILVRGVWSDITPSSHHYEESYSNNGGKTWAAAFIADLTREKEPAATAVQSSEHTSTKDDGQHGFDWDLGTWKIHMSRLSHPLTGSATWTEMNGVTVNSKVWDGRANLAEVEADGAGGHLELLALRLYNPATQEWNVNFATSGVGILNTPTSQPIIGEFKNGRGEFYDQEPYNGRSILVRFRIGPISPDSAQSEQAFSDDGGKTWEVNWINKYTRMKEK
jgi:hypothetical protein